MSCFSRKKKHLSTAHFYVTVALSFSRMPSTCLLCPSSQRKYLYVFDLRSFAVSALFSISFRARYSRVTLSFISLNPESWTPFIASVYLFFYLSLFTLLSKMYETALKCFPRHGVFKIRDKSWYIASNPPIRQALSQSARMWTSVPAKPFHQAFQIIYFLLCHFSSSNVKQPVIIHEDNGLVGLAVHEFKLPNAG